MDGESMATFKKDDVERLAAELSAYSTNYKEDYMQPTGQSENNVVPIEDIRRWFREKYDYVADDYSMRSVYYRYHPNVDSISSKENKKGEKSMSNPIEPNHYTDMEISPLEFIEANQDVLTWCTSNVIKYVGRHQRKNGLEDLKKAQWYLNHEIERLDREEKESK